MQRDLRHPTTTDSEYVYAEQDRRRETPFSPNQLDNARVLRSEYGIYDEASEGSLNRTATEETKSNNQKDNSCCDKYWKSIAIGCIISLTLCGGIIYYILFWRPYFS